jgi:ubiquinone/menaquinone biosynthesis C-methylase UbiE
MKEDKIREIVREKYGELARTERSCCQAADTASCCCSLPNEVSKQIGYKDDELNAVPQGANLGLGCGNPVAIASLKEGETILDLGSGAGFDCFLAANKVGENGRVIGVDMTPEMIEKARQNAKKGSYANVEFRLGEIENLPAADNSVDVVISNCVINLAPNKSRVFNEAFRVLRPGGRFMISDMVLTKELPNAVKESVEAYVGCVAGAIKKEEYLETIRLAGFHEIRTVDETPFPTEVISNDPTAKEIIEKSGLRHDEIEDLAGSVLSISVCGIKPKETT